MLPLIHQSNELFCGFASLSIYTSSDATLREQNAASKQSLRVLKYPTWSIFQDIFLKQITKINYLDNYNIDTSRKAALASVLHL